MTAGRLSAGTLALVRAASVPSYDRARVTPGIVHLGIGNFHRAHQAAYVDDCLAADPSWGILGVSLRRPDIAEALNPQDGLYALVAKDQADSTTRIIGSVLGVLDATRDVAPVLRRLAAPETRIVSLTVTEKGYCHNPATGDLDTHHPEIIADLKTLERPRTAPGLLVEALRLRRDEGRTPFTVMCCDNLPANGETVARVVRQLAALRDEGLARWIEGNAVFPSTMVDRIVPGTTEQDRADVAHLIGLQDQAPVMTETFTQWVVEDVFACGRPDFGAVGVQLVSDVAPFETMKLRLLNGAHSTLAYFGQLLGHETVADAMGDGRLAAFVQRMWTGEIIPTVDRPREELISYTQALVRRFRNPALRHATKQIAMDGSQKIPQRLLNTIRDRRRVGGSFDHLAIAVAAWVTYIAGINGRFEVSDPLAASFAKIARRTIPDIPAFANAMLDQRNLFGDLAGAPDFRVKVIAAAASILERGPASVLQTSAP